MTAVLAAIFVFLVVGGAATAWILLVRLRREEQRIGLREMSGMHWREFQRLVLAMMEARGFMQASHPSETSNQALLELERGGQLWLLSTHHGAGYVPGKSAIAELANNVRLRGAQGAWLTTPSTLAPALVSQARLHKIELLDWPTLWTEIRPLLEPAQRNEIVGSARGQARRDLLLSWGAALVAGVATHLLLGTGFGGEPRPAAPATADAVPGPRESGAAQDAGVAGRPADEPPSAPPQAPAEAAPPTPQTPAEIAERRKQVAQVVGTLPWVDRAVWSTASTLVVYMATDVDADREELCGLVKGFPELRTSRLQLQPPSGSERNVRFIQCSSY